MARKRTPSPRPAQSTLPKDRCPNCSGPLTFPENQPEAFCPQCEIFVEILRPLPKSAGGNTSVESVEKRRGLAKMYLEFEELFREEPDEEPEAPPAPTEPSSPPTQVEPSPLVAAAEAPTEPPEPARPSEPTPAKPERTEPERPAAVPPSLVAPPAPPALPPGPSGPIAPAPVVAAASAGAVPAPESVPTVLPPEPAPLESPTPGIGIEVPDEAYLDAGPYVEGDGSATAGEGPQPKRWHRVVFFTGSALVAFGGSGLVAGSLLHDVLRVPFIGRAYETFGPLNVSAAVLGTLFLAGGLIAMGVGILAGSRPKPVPGG